MGANQGWLRGAKRAVFVRKRPLLRLSFRFSRMPTSAFSPAAVRLFPRATVHISFMQPSVFFACYLPSFLAETAHRFSVKLFYHIRRLLSIGSASICLPLKTLYTRSQITLISHAHFARTPLVALIPLHNNPFIAGGLLLPAVCSAFTNVPLLPLHSPPASLFEKLNKQKFINRIKRAIKRDRKTQKSKSEPAKIETAKHEKAKNLQSGFKAALLGQESRHGNVE